MRSSGCSSTRKPKLGCCCAGNQTKPGAGKLFLRLPVLISLLVKTHRISFQHLPFDDDMQISDQENAGLNEINLTSLIDVALVLVVIFMVMTPMIMQSQIMVSAPKVGKAAGNQRQVNARTEVHISRTGGILLNDSPVSPQALPEALREQLSQTKNKLVVVSADEQVVHDRVVTILDVARQAGAKELSIVKRRL